VLFYFVVAISARVPTGEVWPTPFFLLQPETERALCCFVFSPIFCGFVTSVDCSFPVSVRAHRVYGCEWEEDSQ
jgi:hypothetical protein